MLLNNINLNLAYRLNTNSCKMASLLYNKECSYMEGNGVVSPYVCRTDYLCVLYMNIIICETHAQKQYFANECKLPKIRFI